MDMNHPTKEPYQIAFHIDEISIEPTKNVTQTIIHQTQPPPRPVQNHDQQQQPQQVQTQQFVHSKQAVKPAKPISPPKQQILQPQQQVYVQPPQQVQAIRTALGQTGHQTQTISGLIQQSRNANQQSLPSVLHRNEAPSAVVVKRTKVINSAEVQTRRFVNQQSHNPPQSNQPQTQQFNQQHQIQKTQMQHIPTTQQIQQVHQQSVHQIQQPIQHVQQQQSIVQQILQPNNHIQQAETQMSIIQNFKLPPLQKPKITPAAPFPSLPSNQQIQDAIHLLNEEIKSAKAELTHLEHVQQRGIFKVADYRTRSPEINVQYYKGFIIPHNMVNAVEAQSQKRATASQSMYTLAPTQNQVKFRQVVDLPFMKEQITRHEDVMEPMLRTLKNWKSIVAEKSRLLTRQYVERHALWEQFNGPLCEYTHESRKHIDLWPPEFAKTTLKSALPEASLLHWVSNDEPMYLDEMEKRQFTMYDMNRYVEDPVAEHLAYKRRLVWTEQEVKIFLERYTQHPREFKRIATALPSKCVKDVIEFYHIHRIDLNLKEIEVASRKKGQRTKRISEGSIRK
ncbi:hypothetical protein TRFO_21872 [Tritrichomonas foetus]|uniref:SANT domain-containing protein n=1 Tax=Tritrichomonas foetus TaxID=1144522 RepID=A0A1J4KCZ6_9EUKA|nr:hypothetical protein TRFO_21872 [Tritrichomonas foetus]|eukprot:OHT09303.1 hypothetical protein TRFO_21872 [Tritrichomonas foetus]